MISAIFPRTITVRKEKDIVLMSTIDRLGISDLDDSLLRVMTIVKLDEKSSCP